MKIFQQERSNLYHNRLLNGLLMIVASNPLDINSKFRNDKFVDALNGNDERKEIILLAFNRWSTIKEDILSFLNCLTIKYGLVISEECKQTRADLIEQLPKIDIFIKQFILNDKDNVDYSLFWEAIDHLTQFFRNLGTNDKHYILDFNPNLITDSHE